MDIFEKQDTNRLKNHLKGKKNLMGFVSGKLYTKPNESKELKNLR